MIIRKWLHEQSFNPGAFGWLVNPFWLARRSLLSGLSELASELSGNLLDVGCGTRPYAALFRHTHYIGLELDTPMARARGGADVFYGGSAFPFADGSFDSLLCNQVLEHVPDPIQFLDECARVLKPDGKLLLSVPFVWDEHEAPYDYFRYTRYGLRQLAMESGFNILVEKRLTTGGSALTQLAACSLWTSLRQWPNPARFLLRIFILPPLMLLGLLLAPFSPSDSSLYLDHVQLWQKSAHARGNS